MCDINNQEEEEVKDNYYKLMENTTNGKLTLPLSNTKDSNY